MLVDYTGPTPVQMNSSSTPSLNDFEEYLHTELFGLGPTTASSPGAGSSSSSSHSRASSPSTHSDSQLSHILSTPPQATMENSFPPVSGVGIPDPFSFLGSLGLSAENLNGLGLGGGLGTASGTSFFNFLDAENHSMKAADSSSSTVARDSATGVPFDFMSALGLTDSMSTSSGSSSAAASGAGEAMSIDPQLVDSPLTHTQSDFGEGEDGGSGDDDAEDAVVAEEPSTTNKKSTRSSTKSHVRTESEDKSSSDEKEKLTLTIAPVKVGGYGKAGRKGTVQNGGITKKVASSPPLLSGAPSLAIPMPVSAASNTNMYFPSTSTTAGTFALSSSFPSAATTFTSSSLSKNKENNFGTLKDDESNFGKDGKDDDDDLPADWRPPPEVFAKMTSKEKRQLRNKISARNFRVRRKEYISTLEMDIAERDKLLQAVRSELGSTQSENLALRQEVAALKKALIEGRGANAMALSTSSPVARTASPAMSIRGTDINLNAAAVTIDDLNLPPPAPLPERSAAEELALRAAAAASTSASSSNSNNLLVPNTQKDLPTSPRLGGNGGFWGGISQTGFGGFGGGLGGGFTPVHTVLMPDLNANLSSGQSIGQWVRDVLAANAINSGAGNQSRENSPELQENMNPVMQQQQQEKEETNGWGGHGNASPHGGFDGFVDMNPFTMKTLDAYRMQLWTKMASSHQASPPHSHSPHQTSSPPHQFQQQPHAQPHHSPASSPSSMSPTSSMSSMSSSSYAAQRKALERELSSSSPFTLPTHQHGVYQNNHQSHLNTTPLLHSLKPAYFVNSNKPNLPHPSSSSNPPRMGNTLSALLAGKHSTPSALGSFGVYSPPGSPNLGRKNSGSHINSGNSSSSSGAGTVKSNPTPAQVQQAQNAMYAAALASTASQTLLGRLGGAFWDAFSGSNSAISHSSSPSPTSGSGSHSVGGTTMKSWDADKVRKVLEGKAVVRVVDVDEIPASSAGSSSSMAMSSSPIMAGVGAVAMSAATAGTTGVSDGADKCSMTSLLEESMRSLSLGHGHGHAGSLKK